MNESPIPSATKCKLLGAYEKIILKIPFYLCLGQVQSNTIFNRGFPFIAATKKPSSMQWRSGHHLAQPSTFVLAGHESKLNESLLKNLSNTGSRETTLNQENTGCVVIGLSVIEKLNGYWSFDKARWRDTDMVSKGGAKFPDPPDPSTFDTSKESKRACAGDQ